MTRGIGELQEAGLVPIVVEQLWNTNRLVNQTSTLGNLLKAMFGYTGTPSLTRVMAYTVYLVGVGWAYLRPVRLPVRAPRAHGLSKTIGRAVQPHERRA